MLDMLNMAPTLLAEIQLDDKAFGLLGGLLGTGLIVMGAAKGIGQLAGSAVEAIARQPEAGNRIFTTMIIAAALIEGVTLFALIICLLAVMG
jgi:F-type H+-transporting ATPase subunit c